MLSVVNLSRYITITLFIVVIHELDDGLSQQTNLISKRGAAYNDASLVPILTSTNTVSWAYNWDPSPNGDLPCDIEYIPMLWGMQLADGWFREADAAINAGSRFFLGFNEPDDPQQANMSPSDAATAYRQYLTPYANRVALGTPAITNGGGAMGLEWMERYLAACSCTCGQRFMVIHWYGAASAANEFKQHIVDAMDLASLYDLDEIWITEFAAFGDPSAQVQFLHDIVPWLDGEMMVGRYAYFLCADGSLLNGTGLSEVGQAYTT
jgi:hypothetical protein